jgi:hypothetical protein
MASQVDNTGEPIDAFILFNEREEGVASIVDELTVQGVSTYFWRRDIKAGEAWEKVESEKIRSAGAVLVFLGDHGWGQYHLRLAIEALSVGTHIIPVLIGEPPPEAFKEAGGIFVNLRYVDLRVPSRSAFDLLLQALRSGRRTDQFDGLIGRLVDGDEADRSAVLEQVIDGTIADKVGLAERLREELQNRFSPETESRFPSAVRDPNLMPSIRSWMLSVLIWVDAESPRSRELILRQFSVQSEAERNVRFWTLAGLYQYHASYIDSAIKLCVSDPMPEVALLAEALTGCGRCFSQHRSMTHGRFFGCFGFCRFCQWREIFAICWIALLQIHHWLTTRSMHSPIRRWRRRRLRSCKRRMGSSGYLILFSK